MDHREIGSFERGEDTTSETVEEQETENEVDCELCSESFDHYDFLIDHVQNVHSSAEVYSHFSEDNPYK